MASANRYHYVKAGRVHFFCPLCHHHQSTNTIRRVSAKNIGQLLLLTSTAAFVAWPLFEAKGIALFFPFWGIFEFFYRLRKRQALVCESCGFDPFLYRQDVKKARSALRKHWENRIETENLFAGKKLKNYRTGSIPGANTASTAATQAATKGATAAGAKNAEPTSSSSSSP